MRTGYGKTERYLGKVLDTFPQIRSSFKLAYLKLNYFLYREKGFECYVHPQVSMEDVSAYSKNPTDNVHEFFGYYDKSPWSQDMNSFLIHRWDGGKNLQIVRYSDQEDTVIATTQAWNFQQGAMTQWTPINSPGMIVFNGIKDENLISIWLDNQGNQVQIPFPVQVLHPQGNKALSLNYRRLDRLRPDYGYKMPVKNFSPDQPLEKDGIWQIDLNSGNSELIISLSELINIQPRLEMEDAEHKVNHILYSPKGTRFVFMHRWLSKVGKFSRLYVANSHDISLKILLDDRMVSHYSWEDEDHLLAWARHSSDGDRYYRINVVTGSLEVVGKDVLDVLGDGHPSFSPDRRWIITDSYPDRRRQRHLLLFDRQNEKLTLLGRFLAPWAFEGEERTDLHPRWSPDGNKISIDSSHKGIRRNYILDISRLIN